MSRGPAGRKRPLWLPLGAIAAGLLLFALAAAGGIQFGLLPGDSGERGWQLLLSVLGIGLLALGALLLADEREGRAGRPRDKGAANRSDFGIKMYRPKRYHRKMTIYGEYSNLPPKDSLRLFTVTEGGRFRPQAVAKFDERSRRWRADVDLGPGPYYSVYVAAALVDEPGQALWDYFYQVGQQTDWELVAGGFGDYAWELDRFLVEGTLYE